MVPKNSHCIHHATKMLPCRLGNQMNSQYAHGHQVGLLTLRA
uniref:Uncharacterized protein n=1 Tax=Arundo donax TaxID=35708 RepID=A0A0A9AAT7_ARUDO